jgi:hypothetical protein
MRLWIDTEFKVYLSERDKALRELDVTFGREDMPDITDEIALIGLHKARYETKSIEFELRQESGQWLRARGYKRMGGLELLPAGELPT